MCIRDRDRVFESFTAMCPSDLCAGVSGGGGNLVGDTLAVLANSVLPPSLAGRIVAPLGEQWSGFGEVASDGQVDSSADDLALSTNEDDLARLDFQRRAIERAEARFGSSDVRDLVAAFLSGLDGLELGGFAYAHLNVPHSPWVYVPDGTRYPAPRLLRWSGPGPGLNGIDPPGEVVFRQRLVLQTMFADTILGEVLDSLERQGLLDETLFVVTADHGITTQPGARRRGDQPDAAGEVYDDVLPVPLFVKAPGQATGVVDPRDAQTVDLLPTVLDLLGIDDWQNWDLDGVSLVGDIVESRSSRVLGVGELARAPDPLGSAERQWQLLGQLALNGEIFAVGPFAELVGERVDDPEVSAALGERQVGPVEEWRDVDPASGELPLLVALTDPIRVEKGDWLAAALNGVIAGVGPVFAKADGRLLAEVMVDPAAVVPGRNTLEVFSIASS